MKCMKTTLRGSAQGEEEKEKEEKKDEEEEKQTKTSAPAMTNTANEAHGRRRGVPGMVVGRESGL